MEWGNFSILFVDTYLSPENPQSPRHDDCGRYEGVDDEVAGDDGILHFPRWLSDDIMVNRFYTQTENDPQKVVSDRL